MITMCEKVIINSFILIFYHESRMNNNNFNCEILLEDGYEAI